MGRKSTRVQCSILNMNPSLSSGAHLILFLLPMLTCSCPLDLLTCQGKNANTDVTQCSAHKIQCVNSTLRVQFQGEEHWYETRDILFPEKTFKLLDPNFGKHLQHGDCDFFYNFSDPIRGFYPSHVIRLIPPSTLFNCAVNSYDFANDVFQRQYERSHCTGYELYYSHHPGSPEHGNGCLSTGPPMVEWGMQFNEAKSSVVDFSLLSVAFTHRRNASLKCFGCVMREGKCSAVAAGSSDCHCNFHCHIGTSNSGHLNIHRKVIIAICALLAGFLLAIVAFYVWLKRRPAKLSISPSRNLLFRSETSKPASLVKDMESQSDGYFHTPIFTFEELEAATGRFDSCKELGKGGFGIVYKGVLKDGRVVAVKRLHERNYQRVQQFRNEVEILNRIRHPNLVSLYGCTTRDSRDLLLVYEYISNGTLADHLHGSRASERLLAWPIRLSIATDTAAALAYLHATEPQIIHRDVKTTNMLLDNGFHVKVADFGLSRAFPSPRTTHVSTAPQGTPGYVDPEYHQCYQLTDKSDVYSFGVVLVELISSKPAVDMDRPRSEINLSNMAIAKIPRGHVGELVDANLGYDTDPDVRRTIEAVAELAFRCLQPEKEMRPSMDEVRVTLKKLHNGDERKSSVGEKKARDDTRSLLKSPGVVSLSPDAVVHGWPSRSTLSAVGPY